MISFLSGISDAQCVGDFCGDIAQQTSFCAALQSASVPLPSACSGLLGGGSTQPVCQLPKCGEGRGPMFNFDAQKLECVDCPAGYFSTGRQNAHYCQACDKGFYNSHQGWTSCSPCPSGTTTSGTGSASVFDCTCTNGKSLKTKMSCIPDGISAEGFYSCLECG